MYKSIAVLQCSCFSIILIELPVYELETQKDLFIRFTAIFHVYALDSKRQIIWDTSHNVVYY